MKQKSSSPCNSARKFRRNAPPFRSRLVTKAVSQRYRGQDRVNANTLRLRAVVALFRLSPSAIGKATGFSRCYISRLLSRKNDFIGSSAFFRALECKLGTLIDQRASQYFTIPAVSVARARNVLGRLPVEQATGESEMARAASSHVEN